MTRQVHTGADDPERIGDTALYHGNRSLLAADGKDSWLKVYGTDATQDVPRKWEGFDEYKMTYMFRSTGLERLGNDTLVSGPLHFITRSNWLILITQPLQNLQSNRIPL